MKKIRWKAWYKDLQISSGPRIKIQTSINEAIKYLKDYPNREINIISNRGDQK